MQTFLPFLLVWDESKTVMENLQACFRLSAQLLDYKRTGKQRVEAKQLLDILLGRNPDSSWKRHPVLHMWKPWTEALKLYYNCFLEEWMARGFVNNLVLEDIDEDALNEQGVPPFLSNKHFVDRHRANLMTKHPDFYQQYDWGVEPREGYFWYIDGVYVLTKYGKRFESDLSGEHAPPEPEPPAKKRKPRVKKEVKEEAEGEEENGEEGEGEDGETTRTQKKSRKKEKTALATAPRGKRKVKTEKVEKEADERTERSDDDDFMPPKRIRKRRKEAKIKVEEEEEEEEAENDDVEGKVKERDRGAGGEDEEAEERPANQRPPGSSAKAKQDVSNLVASFAFASASTSASSSTLRARRAKQTKQDPNDDHASSTAALGAVATATPGRR